MENKYRKKPTFETYEPLQRAFDHINKRLFDSELPPVLITLQRQANTMGYLSTNRFTNDKGEYTHELALNPDYFSLFPISEIIQTIGHEACHLWQSCYGKPSRKGYHNKEWSQKMISIGLMPSTTGKEGGALTGQKMNDYIIKDGIFEEVCNELLTNKFKIEWFDRFPPIKNENELNHGGSILQSFTHSEENNSKPLNNVFQPKIKQSLVKKPQQTRVKFTCPICKANLWGKPSLNIQCLDCNQKFELNERLE